MPNAGNQNSDGEFIAGERGEHCGPPGARAIDRASTEFGFGRHESRRPNASRERIRACCGLHAIRFVLDTALVRQLSIHQPLPPLPPAPTISPSCAACEATKTKMRERESVAILRFSFRLSIHLRLLPSSISRPRTDSLTPTTRLFAPTRRRARDAVRGETARVTIRGEPAARSLAGAVSSRSLSFNNLLASSRRRKGSS